MRRRFRSVTEPLAFAARLRNRRDASSRVAPVARILRRFLRPVLQRLWIPVHFALQVMQRAAAPWDPPRPAVSPPPSPSAGIIRERFHLSTRLLERTLRVLHAHHTHMRVSVAPRSPAAPSNVPPPTRVVMMQRVERQTLFPRVTQVLARASSTAAIRGQSAALTAPETTAPRLAPRPGVPHAAAPAARALPPAELARVTDHVIRQLDQRVLSYRERTGQV
jgi:hypothetical protein